MSSKQLNSIIKLIKSWDHRLEWDDYFMSIAFLSSSRSPCSRLHVGCILVKDNRIISTGYNGFLSGALHNSYIRDKHEQATVHSEHNSVSDCAKRGVSTINSTAYVTHFPCLNCFKLLSAAGVSKIMYAEDYNNDPYVFILANESNVLITQYPLQSNSTENTENTDNTEKTTIEY
jgi:dCMP deaminase